MFALGLNSVWKRISRSLFQTDANTIEQVNGVSPQKLNVYNTRTGAGNYERGFMRFASNVLEIGAEKAGTGTARALRLFAGGVGQLNITDGANGSNGITLSAGSSQDLFITSSSRVGFSSNKSLDMSAAMSIGKNGLCFGDFMGEVSISFRNGYPSDAKPSLFKIYGNKAYSGATTNLVGGALEFVAGAGASASAGAAHGGDVIISGGLAYGTGLPGKTQVRNGTQAQHLSVAYSWTDASNYQRLALSATATAIRLIAESAGTGAADIDVEITPKGAGVVKIGALPTTNPGPGILWNNAGTPAIGT